MFAAKLTTKQKEELPHILSYRLRKKTGKSAFYKFTFFQKWFVLFKAMNKRVFIVIEDEELGLTTEDYIKWKAQQKKRVFDSEDAKNLVANGICVLGNQQLCDWLGYINNVSVSAAYQYALRISAAKPINFPEYRKEFSFFTEMLVRYEGSKKKMIGENNMTMAEVFVLLYLYDGKERIATPTYEYVFKGSFQSSRATILRAFKRLKNMDLLQMVGTTKDAKWRITPLGKQRVNEIISRYILPK